MTQSLTPKEAEKLKAVIDQGKKVVKAAADTVRLIDAADQSMTELDKSVLG